MAPRRTRRPHNKERTMDFEIHLTLEVLGTDRPLAVEGKLPEGAKRFQSSNLSVRELADELAQHVAPVIEAWIARQDPPDRVSIVR